MTHSTGVINAMMTPGQIKIASFSSFSRVLITLALLPQVPGVASHAPLTPNLLQVADHTEFYIQKCINLRQKLTLNHFRTTMSNIPRYPKYSKRHNSEWTISEIIASQGVFFGSGCVAASASFAGLFSKEAVAKMD